MNIYLTLDYELYFGARAGTQEKCILNPTNELIKILDKYQVKCSFFVDSGYLIQLQKHSTKYSILSKDYHAICEQIQHLYKSGHDIQLHIHPHWEDSYYDGEKWVMNIQRYKLADFSEQEINDIVDRYSSILSNIIGCKPNAYRAGGWCLQPFSKIKNALKKNGIEIDSSVFIGGKNIQENYFYDYTNAPLKDKWRFENDPLVEDKNGSFCELPITSKKIQPFFFWKLFFWGRLLPNIHKPLGDGFPIAIKGYRKKLLTKSTIHPASVDGYFSVLLQQQLKNEESKGHNHFVLMGHPKSLTRFSLQTLEKWIEKNHKKHRFVTYSKQTKEA